MKIAKYICTLSVACLFTCLLPLLAATPEAEFIKIEREYTLRADGSTEARYRKELKIHTHRAMNSMYGETFIVYNPLYQEIKFHSSYTKQVDGGIVQTPSNAFNEVLPADAANAPAYNHLKEMVVTHTGLELGATIYLDYSVISKPGYLPALDIAETLEELSPVGEYLITICVPQGKKANYSLTGISGKMNQEQENNYIRYRWVLKNIPASTREVFRPQVAGDIPYFTFNTYSSTREMLEGINYPDDLSVVSLPEATDRGGMSADEKIETVHRYITKDMGFCRLAFIESGKMVRSPQEVTGTAYGTAAEKALLTNILLGKEGVLSNIAALYPRGLTMETVGFAPVKEIGVITDYKGERVFLSMDNGQLFPLPEISYRYDIHVLNGLSLRKLSVAHEGETALSTFNQQISITADSVKREKLCLLSGMVPGIYYTSGKYISNKDGADRLSFKTTETESRKLNWDESGYFKLTPGEYNTGVNSFGMNRLGSERKSPLAIPFKTEDKVIQTISLAPGILCKTPSCGMNLKNKAGTLRIELTNENDKVTISKHIKLDKAIYSPAEYSDLRKLILEWNNPNINAVILYNESAKR